MYGHKPTVALSRTSSRLAVEKWLHYITAKPGLKLRVGSKKMVMRMTKLQATICLLVKT